MLPEGPLVFGPSGRDMRAYLLLVLLGVGTLLSFNSFITEKEWWDVRLHQPPVLSVVADDFLSVFSTTFTLGCAICPSCQKLLLLACINEPYTDRSLVAAVLGRADR